METFPILSMLIGLPALGALVIALLVRGQDEEQVAQNARSCALWTSVLTFLLSLSVLGGFKPEGKGAPLPIPDMQFMESFKWLTRSFTKDGTFSEHTGLMIDYSLAIDGISLPFLLLTTFLTPICILASWESITTRVRQYMIAFLLLESLVLGVFCATNLLLFYLFFEAMLIPMFLIIGVWGGERRIYAAFKFFLYTLAGSVFFLLAMVYLFWYGQFLEGGELYGWTSRTAGHWLFLAFLIAFAVKIPMWPFHTWLPDAHVQAPTAGSVILAGILLKVGGYGFLRFSLPIFGPINEDFAPWIMGVSVVAIVYASLVALMQRDMKKLIAYSSVAHMGFVTLGIFSFTLQGIEGAIVQMVSHGIVSAAWFLCVGALYDRMHTREIARFGGVVEAMPRYAMLAMIFMLAAVGLPGTSGFVGEFLVLMGTYQVSKLATAVAVTGFVLGAAYMLWLYARVFLGKPASQEVKALQDLTPREMLMLVPMAVLVLVLGIYPSLLTNIVHPAALSLVREVKPQSQERKFAANEEKPASSSLSLAPSLSPSLSSQP